MKQFVFGVVTLVVLCTSVPGQGTDACTTPTAISGAGPFSFSNGAATTGTQGQSNSACLFFGSTTIDRDVWFVWTAPATGMFTLTACTTTTVDTKVAVYAGNGCPGAAPIACNDDACNYQSQLTFSATSGAQYTIQFGTYPGAAGGTGTFAINAGSGGCPAPSTGPDVIVGDLTGPANYTSSGGIDALSLGTTSCNIGDTNLLWQASNTLHPVIGGNLYRYKVVNGAGRFEQVGMSWLKHGFAALTQNLCCTCNNPGTSQLLGVGCSDPYTATRNGSQSGLGPRWQVNANNGVYTYPPANPSWSGSTPRRLEVLSSDLEVTGGGNTTRYFGEAHYVTQDDATSGNQDNNVSWREMSVSGGTSDYAFAFVGTTTREEPALRAWKVADPAVTLTEVQFASEGLVVLGSRVTNLGGGTWHYEYALYNMNSDDSVRSFSLPIQTGVTITNAGFHDIAYRNGDGPSNVNYSGTDWSSTQAGGVLSWSTQTLAQNASANALRWGSTYNFRFDANTAPTSGTITLGRFKSGLSEGVSVEIPSAGSPPADADGDGVADSVDNCPTVANSNQANADLDAFGDACDTCTDTDGDGWGDPGYPGNTCALDLCPTDPAKHAAGVCGCGVPDTDSDADGVANCIDNCPNHSNPTQADCNGDGIGNVCAIAGGAADVYGVTTCVADGIPDSCQPQPDCDADGLPDRCEISGGSPDVYGVTTCVPDGVPDLCQPQPDCDLDGIPNRCEIQAGSPDIYGVTTCVPDGIPDVCQPQPDCDLDGIPNRCEIQAGAADQYGVTTCVADGIPDSCQPQPDCDADGTPDRCEIQAGSPDIYGVTTCVPDGIPDVCQPQPDCDLDGIPNRCEIQGGAADQYGVTTCVADGIPDSCQPQPDCDADGIPDRCEILAGSPDIYGVTTCVPDGIPDVCQPQPDCDLDGIPNRCEIQAGAADQYGVTTCVADGIPDSCQPQPDCDNDGVPNRCEIQAGSPDLYGAGTCAPDGVPDVCQPEPDCDADGIPNRCEIQAGAADQYGVTTCVADGIPDSCQPQPDCDADGIPDRCEIQAGSPDVYGVTTCVPDGIPDVCQPQPDCDNDGVPNRCEIQAGSPDLYGTGTCTPDGVPDACQPEPDCDADGIPNRCEIQAGAADQYGVTTCVADGVPDSCQPQPDCDSDGIPDRCEIQGGAPDQYGVTTCVADGVPDSCQPQPDCDNDGIPNRCEIAAGSLDCNLNLVPDACDIALFTSTDTNLNGVPDECEAGNTAFCPGDGTGTACPCGNNSPLGQGQGCLNSLGLGGKLQTSGTASITSDTLLLAGSNMPNSFALYFQGTTQQAAGNGAVFGDGKRCAGGSVLRLGTFNNVAGSSAFPNAIDPTPVHVKGSVGAPAIRTYQIWYRNPASFCTASTFNLSNGMQVVWVL